MATPTSGPSAPSNGGGSPFKMALIVLFVLVGLTLSFGAGYLLLRRMLMSSVEVKLKPSGARPWTRTRIPGLAGQAAQTQRNTASTVGSRYEPVSYDMASSNNASMPSSPSTPPALASNPNPSVPGAMQGGFEPQTPGFQPTINASPLPQAQGFGPLQAQPGPNMQGYDPKLWPSQSGYPVQGYGQTPSGYGTPATGFGAFSDSFVPPSPRVFPQSDFSMLPPTTGSHPTPPTTRQGYAPASNAFNALYGLSDTASGSAQPGAPGWLDQLAGSGNPAGRQLPETPHPPAANAPNMDETTIRRYNQQNPAPQPPGNPGSPNSEWPQ